MIDVQIFTREGMEKDPRAKAIEEETIDAVAKELQDQLRIREDAVFAAMEKLLLSRTPEQGPNKLKAGGKITKPYLVDLPREKWSRIHLQDDKASKQLEAYVAEIKQLHKLFKTRLQQEHQKIVQGDDAWYVSPKDGFAYCGKLSETLYELLCLRGKLFARLWCV